AFTNGSAERSTGRETERERERERERTRETRERERERGRDLVAGSPTICSNAARNDARGTARAGLCSSIVHISRATSSAASMTSARGLRAGGSKREENSEERQRE